ncbi:hypothetical protein B0H19DRAFT_1213809 [Mycena capillaripes]|nr:hypothetical protein B0H19DRAFT_1213809 [Mycena capillaripes]
MIARCQEDDYSTPVTQQGVRGHVIVYRRRPSAIAKALPPSIDEVTTPIHVIFIGSNPPNSEWLLKKTRPLTSHNSLYKDIEINASLFDGQPDEAILPFHVQHVLPSRSNLNFYFLNNPVSSSLPVLSEIVQPPTTTRISFVFVVVTDVEGHTSSSELRRAAVEHLKMPGKKYIGIPHDSNPINELKNPALFPMIYPFLYPYGIEAARTPGANQHFRCAPT